MKAYMRKMPGGLLRPENEESEEQLKWIKVGDVVSVEVKRTRNYKRLQAIHCLFKIAYDHFCEYGIGEMEYKGYKIVPSYKRFRHELVILAGHYTHTVNIRGEVKVDHKSIAYTECSQEEFEKIFSDVINAAVKYIYKNTTNEKALREAVENILSFATY